MTLNEYIEITKNANVNDSYIKELEKIYGEISEEYIKQIYSTTVMDYFFEAEDILRLLTPQEILVAPENLHVNFREKKCIPLFDTGDNDFIVYLLEKNVWSYFNIVNQTFFSEADSLLSMQ